MFGGFVQWKLCWKIPVERYMDEAWEVGGICITNSFILFPSSSLSLIFSPRSLVFSSCTDHINIPLKLVSAAARSPLLLCLSHLFSLPSDCFLMLPLCCRDNFPYCFYQLLLQGVALLLPSVRSSPCCTCECSHTHMEYSCLWQSMLIGPEWLLPLVGECVGYF